MRTNGQIIKSTITTTSDQTALNYEQVDKFTEMAYESTEFLKGIRTVNKISSKGTLDKIGVTGRNLRSKVENKEATNTAAPTFPQVPYAVAPVVLPFEITEEFIRQTERVRGQNAEEIIMAAMTKNYGENMQDIGFNGDIATPSTDPDYAFLSINDGWLKLAKTKGNFIDWTTLPDVKKKGVFFEIERAIPTRLRTGGVFKYFMHPNTFSERIQALAEKDTSASIQLQITGGVKKINAYDVVEVAHMPEGAVLFTYHDNFALVNTYDMQIRKTTEGREAIYADKRFYAIHSDYDSIFEEPGAVAYVEGVEF
ncbi:MULTISPECIES: P2 family phage major capsid protein [Paenibacillus]|uniref:P2 family phage major capsid protein n=1 Tax=Paenibacillus TaxID=44249 RepID=UPI00096CC49E|nr:MULTISPECIES: P2 family phage major capsid protein [Paenibacillus]OMF31968.1 major capsid protein [Paenibacillus peoriae]URJ47386.3 P2 family phage major capsid protein [Paenibacillus polymyxa]